MLGPWEMLGQTIGGPDTEFILLYLSECISFFIQPHHQLETTLVQRLKPRGFRIALQCSWNGPSASFISTLKQADLRPSCLR